MASPIPTHVLTNLARRYGLVGPGSGGDFNALLQAGTISAQDAEFLRNKAQALAQGTPEQRPLLDLASSMGYLSTRALLRIGFKVGYQGANRDYLVASHINSEKLMPFSRLIDLLERLALPLFYCPRDGALYYPEPVAAALQSLSCRACGQQLVPLTSIAALRLEAVPLPDLTGRPLAPVEAHGPGFMGAFDPLSDDELLATEILQAQENPVAQPAQQAGEIFYDSSDIIEAAEILDAYPSEEILAVADADVARPARDDAEPFDTLEGTIADLDDEFAETPAVAEAVAVKTPPAGPVLDFVDELSDLALLVPNHEVSAAESAEAVSSKSVTRSFTAISKPLLIDED
jgi:hypothetical protein